MSEVGRRTYSRAFNLKAMVAALGPRQIEREWVNHE
jgi:hypothetical protein